MTSSGKTKELQPKKLGVYEKNGYSNNRLYYKNEHSFYLHYAPNNRWSVSSKGYLGKRASLVNGHCDDECPSTCEHWESANQTSNTWVEDKELTIKCAGW